MNFNTVVSLPVSADMAGNEHKAVKLTSTGIALANGSDRIIGTLIRAQVKQENGVSLGKAADIFLCGRFNGFHFITIGGTTGWSMGDLLMRIDGGVFVPAALTGITGTSAGNVFTLNGHGLDNGEKITFSSLTGGSSLTATGNPYYVVGATTNTFQVSLTPSGAVQALGSDVSAASLTRFDPDAIAVEAAPASSVGGKVRALLY